VIHNFKYPATICTSRVLLLHIIDMIQTSSGNIGWLPIARKGGHVSLPEMKMPMVCSLDKAETAKHRQPSFPAFNNGDDARSFISCCESFACFEDSTRCLKDSVGIVSAHAGKLFGLFLCNYRRLYALIVVSTTYHGFNGPDTGGFLNLDLEFSSWWWASSERNYLGSKILEFPVSQNPLQTDPVTQN
jgi:hypothetical protein